MNLYKIEYYCETNRKKRTESYLAEDKDEILDCFSRSEGCFYKNIEITLIKESIDLPFCLDDNVGIYL